MKTTMDSFSWLAVGMEVFTIVFSTDSFPTIRKCTISLIEKEVFEDGPFNRINVTLVYDNNQLVVTGSNLIYKTEKDAKIALDRCEEEGKKVDLVFCKLEGECQPEETVIEQQDEDRLCYERAVKPQLMESILNIDYSGIDFVGEEYYKNYPTSRIGQTYNESGIVRYKKGEKRMRGGGRGLKVVPIFSVEITTDRKNLSLSREELFKIDELCYSIKNIVCKNGNKEEQLHNDRA